MKWNFLLLLFSASMAMAQTGLSIVQHEPNPSVVGQAVVVHTLLKGQDARMGGTVTITDGVDSCVVELPRTYCQWLPTTIGERKLTATRETAQGLMLATPGVRHEVRPITLPERVSMPAGVGQRPLQPFTPAGPGLPFVANNLVATADISADNRWVAFRRLRPGNVIEVFDRWSGTTRTILWVSDEPQTHSVVRMSDDGVRFLFATDEALASEDNNGLDDIYLHDLSTGATRRVSIAIDGGDPNGPSYLAELSADGSFASFSSDATNLVPNDTNQMADVFAVDLDTLVIDRVSVSSDGVQQLLPDGEHWSEPSSNLSADGRFVVFASPASQLVEGDVNGTSDIFVRDRWLRQTERISQLADGTGGNGWSAFPAISADGRYVAYATQAANLLAMEPPDDIHLLRHDRQNGENVLVSVDEQGAAIRTSGWPPALSADGGRVAFTGGPGWAAYLREVDTSITQMVSPVTLGPACGGQTVLPNISPDGSLVLFGSDDRMIDPQDTCRVTSVSPNLPYVVFVVGDDGAYDALVPVVSIGGQAESRSVLQDISYDGSVVVFTSGAQNLDPDDAGWIDDVFLHDRKARSLARISAPTTDAIGAGQYLVNQRHATLASDASVVSYSGRLYFPHSGQTVATGVRGLSLSAGGGLAAGTQTVDLVRPRLRLVDTATGIVTDIERPHFDVIPERLMETRPVVSADGRLIFYFEQPDAYGAPGSWRIYDVVARSSAVEPYGPSSARALSADARLLVFSTDSALTADDDNEASDVYVWDRLLEDLELVSAAAFAGPVNGGSEAASISADGRFVAFSSSAENLVAEGNADGPYWRSDIYVRDRLRHQTIRIANEARGLISGDGQWVAFHSASPEHVVGDTNSALDVFITSSGFLPDLVLWLDSPARTTPGELLRWRLTVRNEGTRETTARVLVAMDARIRDVQWDCDSAVGAVCRPALGSGAPDLELDLEPGASATIAIRGVLAEQGGGLPLLVEARAENLGGLIDAVEVDNGVLGATAVGMFVDGFEKR